MKHGGRHWIHYCMFCCLAAGSAAVMAEPSVTSEDFGIPSPVFPRYPANEKAPKGSLHGLKNLTPKQWGEQEVRRVLHTFAFGGQATDGQIRQWAKMSPPAAIAQMLTVEPVNLRLSPQGVTDTSTQYCDSLEMLQDFWSSDDENNPMRVANRDWYATLDQEEEGASPLHLFLAWTRLMHTPGCNTFLHKLALYITNYHASIHIQNTAPTLIRSYYDDVLQALAGGADFVDLMTLAATHAALSRAYGHMGNYFDQGGMFHGNDDFAREYFQLLFGIQGTTEDEEYHENVTIEHNAWLLSGMALDAQPNAWNSTQPIDWLVAPIYFGNHYDPAGRLISNQWAHYQWWAGEGSCLEILHEMICGRNARSKLNALGPVAAAHPESMASVPLKIIRFFGDDRLDQGEAGALQSAWADAEYDLLAFLRAYAISTTFHGPGTIKLRSAFDRNLLIHNANQLTAQEAYAEIFPEGPIVRMFDQGALVFAPIRDVFGGQTGIDAANDRYVFKSSWDANVLDPAFLAKSSEYYLLEPDGQPLEWRKDWGAVIPAGAGGLHRVDDVGEWLWNRFINDGGRNFDPVARAQVYAILATGLDFGAIADANNMEAVYSSADISSGELGQFVVELSGMTLDLTSIEANERVGLAVSFITALPYSFVMGVE